MVAETGRQLPASTLEEDLGKCSHITGVERKYVCSYLNRIGILSLSEVDIRSEQKYRRAVRCDKDLEERKKPYYAGALESCMLSFLLEQPAFHQLLEEVQSFPGLSRPIRNKVLHFLMMEDLKETAQIDYGIRERFVRYLKEAGCVKDLEYLKALDRLKLRAIEKACKERAFYRPKLTFLEKPVFLLYHPDIRIAREFYFLRDKEEVLFDFSLKASRKLKGQVFSMLNHALELPLNRKNRREMYLVPLKKLYLYCVRGGIEDLEMLEEEDIEGFRQSMEGCVGTKTAVYMQIVDRIRKYLFLRAKETNWKANVWYLERFCLKEERMNPADPVFAFRFYGIRDRDNRALLQQYLKYCIGITWKAVHTIQVEYYSLLDFLRECDRKQWKAERITGKEIDAYFRKLDREKIQADTFNQKAADLDRFFRFLTVKGIRNTHPFHLRYYLKKTVPVHLDRQVPQETQMQMLCHLKDFPEHLRLMYLHLWCLGLRLNDVCTIRGSAYSYDGKDAWIRIYQYKSKTEKQIPIPLFLYLSMTAFIKKRGIQPDDYVFQAENGDAYRAATYSRQMKVLCRKFGISCGDYLFRAHDYRHMIGTKLYQGGASVQAVRDYLGHIHENMTCKYLDLIPERIDRENEVYFQQKGSLSRRFLEEKA